MKLLEAIEKSSRGTATRIVEDDGHKKVAIIGYRSGEGYRLVSFKGKVDFFLSGPATEMEMRNRKDWEPS